jgi:thiamine biosynthesis protein ThiS
MRVKVNGEQYETEKGTIGALLAERGIVAGRVAVEVNLKVIGKAEYDTYRLSEGDVIEVVNFVGGGQHRRDHGRYVGN